MIEWPIEKLSGDYCSARIPQWIFRIIPELWILSLTFQRRKPQNTEIGKLYIIASDLFSGLFQKKYLEGEEGTFILTPPSMELNFQGHPPPM